MEDINKKLDNIINLLEEDKKNQIRSKNERIHIGFFRSFSGDEHYYKPMFSIFGKGCIKQFVLKISHGINLKVIDVLADGKKVFSENFNYDSDIMRNLYLKGYANTEIYDFVLGPFTFNHSFVIAGVLCGVSFSGTILYTLDEEDTE